MKVNDPRISETVSYGDGELGGIKIKVTKEKSGGDHSQKKKSK